MGLQLSGNWRDELLRARVAAQLPADQVNDLWPAYPKNAPVTLAQGDAAPSDAMPCATPPPNRPRR